MTETTPLGTTAKSASNGISTLIARRGDGWVRTTDVDMSMLSGLLPTTDSIAAADAPRFAPGEIISWHDHGTALACRVMSDDERGLVCWVAEGAQTIVQIPLDAEHLRELPLEERVLAPRRTVERAWRGPGVIRVVPTGKPWSVWFFWDRDGSFQGTYVNLELPHRRRPGVAMVETFDLTLDLWFDGDDLWLKDEDELVAYVDAGRLTSEQAQEIYHLADLAREELFEQRQWPMDAGLEDFHADPTWTTPQLPDHPWTAALWAKVAADAEHPCEELPSRTGNAQE